jgi:hypothetical protein
LVLLLPSLDLVLILLDSALIALDAVQCIMVALDLESVLTAQLVLLVCLVHMETCVIPIADIGTITMFPILVVLLTSVVDTLLFRTVVTSAASVLFG